MSRSHKNKRNARSQSRLAAMASLAFPMTALCAPPLELHGTADPFHISQGVGQAVTGVQVFDSDGDGRDEIFYGGEAFSITLRISLDPLLSIYRVDRAILHPHPRDPLAHSGFPYVVSVLEPNGAPKIITQIPNRTIVILDARTLALERKIATTPFWSRPVAARDLDGDGFREIIVFGAEPTVAVFDHKLTRPLLVRGLEGRGDDIAIGNFDGDPNIEFAIESGRVFEFLGPTAIRDDVPLPPTSPATNQRLTGVLAGDVDRDGMDELFTIYDAFEVRLYDYDRAETKWTRDGVGIVARVVDLNRDGVPDLLNATHKGFNVQAGKVLAGEVFAYDGQTGADLFRIQHPDNSVREVAAGDFDGDGEMEIAALFFTFFSGPNRLYLYDVATGSMEWRSTDEDVPVRAAALGDADGDGSEELLYAPLGLVAVGEVRVIAHDPATFASRWITPDRVLPSPGTGRILALAIGDADRDGDPDIVVGTSRDGRATLWILEGRTRALVGGVLLDPGEVVTAVAVADVDGNAGADIVAATLREGMPGEPFEARLHFVDGASGTITWSSGVLETRISDAHALRIGNVDGTGGPDVVLIGYGAPSGSTGWVHIVDGQIRAVRTIAVPPSLGLELLDLAGDAAQELALGGADGTIAVRDGRTGGLLSSRSVCAGSVHALAKSTVSGSPRGEVLFACEDRVGAADLAGTSRTMLSSQLGAEVGYGNKLFVTGTSNASLRVHAVSRMGVRHLRPAQRPPAPYIGPFTTDRPGFYVTHWRPTAFNRSATTIPFGIWGDEPAVIELVEAPLLGTIDVRPQGAPIGQFSYFPRPARGFDAFTVRAVAGGVSSMPVTMMILITNTAPMFTAGTPTAFDVGEGRPQNITPGFFDVDGDPLTCHLLTMPTKGTMEDLGQGCVFRYTPRAGAGEQDSFTARATDGVDDVEPQTFTINIVTPPPPSPPAPQPTSSGGGGGGGELEVILLAMLATLALGRRRRVT